MNLYSSTTTIRDGTLNFDTPLTNAAAILSTGGVLNMNASIDGATLVVAPAAGSARVNITVSERLAALDIGDGGVVTLGAAAPAPFAASAAPEPRALSLLAASALALLANRRRRAQGAARFQPPTQIPRAQRQIECAGRREKWRFARSVGSAVGKPPLLGSALDEPLSCFRKNSAIPVIRFSRGIRM